MNIGIFRERCLGCGACSNKCERAISMQNDIEGFCYPVIDKNKCTDCGRCLLACPLAQAAFKPDTRHPNCYAVQSTADIMQHSSSGGMFTVLADYVLEHNGYVCGASFDKSWSVVHKIISDKNDLYSLQTSKYVQSDTKSVYKDIKRLLNAGSMVLFTGTPCQVAGLYAFLRQDYDNLIAVDVFCHGTPSPEVWKRYLNELAIGDIKDINFRSKAVHGWSGYEFSIQGNDGVMLNEHYTKNIYMLGFLRNLYLRKSCHHCPFTRTPRRSDFSIGDFWGYRNTGHKANIQHGMSAVLVNTDKAEKIFSYLRTRLSFVEETDLPHLLRGNLVLYSSVNEHESRKAFFREFNTYKPVLSIIKKYLKIKDVAILNFSSFSTFNYGACLVGYAMEKAVEKLGYMPSTVYFIPENAFEKVKKQNPFSDFRNKFLHMTTVCRNKADLQRINRAFTQFIIGSDQIVRHPWHMDFVYYLDWLDDSKKRISYAASFGISGLGMNAEEEGYARECLDKFCAFSVREHSGAAIMKRHFGREVPVLCDPTLLLDAADYQQIIDKENQGLVLPEEEYVAYYFLDEKPAVLADFMERYPVVDAYRNEIGRYRSFGQWLNIIKNAKYVITDSYHGSIFSIIYRRQFVVLTTKSRGNDRLETLMLTIGTSRLIADRTNLTEKVLFGTPMDYSRVAERIADARQLGYEYLRAALD